MSFTTDDGSTQKFIFNQTDQILAKKMGMLVYQDERRRVLTNWLPYKATWAKEKAYGSDQRLTNVGDQKSIMIFAVTILSETYVV